VAPAKTPFGLGISMSARHDLVDTVTEVRLSVVAEAAVNLIAQLSELKELRERVRKASYDPEIAAHKPSQKKTHLEKVASQSQLASEALRVNERTRHSGWNFAPARSILK
jgi:hypothetical protein